MLDSEKKQFAEMYRGVCANYGREANPDAMRVAWSALAEYDINTVSRAYSAHVRCSEFMPSAKHILDKIKAHNPAMQRLGADEAFALMPRSEDDSVVWTEEMAYAWSVASHLVNQYEVESPDWVAARMAFKGAYIRAVEAADAQGKPVKWIVARGQRTTNLHDVISEAVRLGRITNDEAAVHLSQLEYQKPMVAGLLEGTKGTPNHEMAKQQLGNIKAMLNKVEPPPNMDEVREECESKDRERRAA